MKDQAGNLLGDSPFQTVAGENLSVTITPDISVTDIVLEVSSADASLHGVGGYSLMMTYDNINQSTQGSVDDLIHFPVRMIELDDLEGYFEDGEQLLANDDGGTDDEPGAELSLTTTPGFIEGTRFQIVASVETIGDVDRYSVQSSETMPAGSESATITLQSVDIGQFTGEVRVFDESGVPIATDIIVHNENQMIVQFSQLAAAGQTYILEVSANSEAPQSTGSYELVARFGTEPIQRETFFSGRLNRPARTRFQSLAVNRPQLFQFMPEASSASAENDAVIEMTIRNAQGQAVMQLSSRVGDTQTKSILLPTGNYKIAVTTIQPGANWTPIDYDIMGAAVDDPLGPRLNDSTEDPFTVTNKLFFATNFFPFYLEQLTFCCGWGILPQYCGWKPQPLGSSIARLPNSSVLPRLIWILR